MFLALGETSVVSLYILLEISVAVPELPGAATFRAAPEPEPIFCWAEPGVGAGAAFFKADLAPAASFRQAKKKSLVKVSNMTLKSSLEGFIWSKIDLY